MVVRKDEAEVAWMVGERVVWKASLLAGWKAESRVAD